MIAWKYRKKALPKPLRATMRKSPTLRHSLLHPKAPIGRSSEFLLFSSIQTGFRGAFPTKRGTSLQERVLPLFLCDTTSTIHAQQNGAILLLNLHYTKRRCQFLRLAPRLLKDGRACWPASENLPFGPITPPLAIACTMSTKKHFLVLLACVFGVLTTVIAFQGLKADNIATSLRGPSHVLYVTIFLLFSLIFLFTVILTLNIWHFSNSLPSEHVEPTNFESGVSQRNKGSTAGVVSLTLDASWTNELFAKTLCDSLISTTPTVSVPFPQEHFRNPRDSTFLTASSTMHRL